MGFFSNLFKKKSELKEELQDSKLHDDFNIEKYGEIILDFQKNLNFVEWESLSDSKFAMWQPCEEDKLFSTSVFYNKWNSIYDITKDYWSYISADIFKSLNIIKEKTFRTTLPDKFTAFGFKTLDNEQIIISLSKEKGIRLHFSADTSYQYRLMFINKFILYCNGWKDFVTFLDKKSDENIGFNEWWEHTANVAIEMEKIDKPEGVGIIIK